MYSGTIKLGELEQEIGTNKMKKFMKKISEEFRDKEKIYFRFLKYERFEDRYTDPEVEEKGNYLQNLVLYEVIGKEEYKRIAEKYGGKKMCITLCKVNISWDYTELEKFFEENEGKEAEEIAKELDLKKVSYVRKLRSRSRNVTKDSLLMNEKK